MRWPLVWRSDFDRVAAMLEHTERELQAERLRARRRARRKPVHQPIEREVPVHAALPDLPPEVIEAIEERAGGLHTRAAAGMLKVAADALQRGVPEREVVAYMWNGEPE